MDVMINAPMTYLTLNRLQRHSNKQIVCRLEFTGQPTQDHKVRVSCVVRAKASAKCVITYALEKSATNMTKGPGIESRHGCDIFQQKDCHPLSMKHYRC